MAITGIGQDGYYRVQKETSYGVAAISSMTLIPVTPDSLTQQVVENIEQENVISSRLKQAPCLGRNLVNGTVAMNYHPTLIGMFWNFFLGGATSVANGAAYDHIWLQPISIAEKRIPTSFTSHQAIGMDLVQEFTGNSIVSMTLEGDTTGNILATFTLATNKLNANNIARTTTFTFPTQCPFNWSFGNISITPDSVAGFNQLINSFSLTIDLNYDPERFKFGDRNILQPFFNGIPTATLSLNIDAEKRFVDWANSHEKFFNTLTFTSTEEAAAGVPFETVIEFPGCRLNPETVIANASELTTMDLEFECGYGGVSTNSGSDAVMFEVRHTDATATYTD